MDSKNKETQAKTRMRTSAFAYEFSEIIDLIVKRSPEAQSRLALNSAVGSKRNHAPISKRREAAVLARDNYTCRYCNYRLISNPVMRAVSIIYPNEFRYHLHGKASESDVALLRDGTCIDHVLPATFGGTNSPDNLVASCWQCNVTKSNFTLEQLDWEIQPLACKNWDGLSGRLPELILLMPSVRTYFTQWAYALRSAEDIASFASPSRRRAKSY